MDKAKNIVLSNETSAEMLKTYFRNIQRMEESGEQFPVNLDEVWPLVYKRKGEAARSLRMDKLFIEGIDYVLKDESGAIITSADNNLSKDYSSKEVFRNLAKNLRPENVNNSENESLSDLENENLEDEKSGGKEKKAKNPLGGRPTDNYFLSTSCLEFFIARRVRPVFEVYRQVFRAVRQGALPWNQTYRLPLKRVGSKAEEVAAYLREVIVKEEDGASFPIAVDDIWRLAYPSRETPTSHLLGKGVRNRYEYKRGIDFDYITEGKTGKEQLCINTHTMLRLFMPRSLKIQMALQQIGYAMPMHELEFAPEYHPTSENSAWFLDMIGMRKVFDGTVEKEVARILKNDHEIRREWLMSEENENEEQRNRLIEQALRPIEGRRETSIVTTDKEGNNLPGLKTAGSTSVDPIEAVTHAQAWLTRLKFADDDEMQIRRVNAALKALMLYEQDLY